GGIWRQSIPTSATCRPTSEIWSRPTTGFSRVSTSWTSRVDRHLAAHLFVYRFLEMCPKISEILGAFLQCNTSERSGTDPLLPGRRRLSFPGITHGHRPAFVHRFKQSA